MGEVAVGSGGHTGLLFVAEAYKTDAPALSDIGKLGDWNTDKAVHGVDTYHFKCAHEDIHAGHLSGICGCCRRSARRSVCC